MWQFLNEPRKRGNNINISWVSTDTETGEREPKHKIGRLFSWTELWELEQEIVLAETVNEWAVAVDFIMDNVSEMWEKLSHAFVWEVTVHDWILVKQIIYRQSEMYYREFHALCY